MSEADFSAAYHSSSSSSEADKQEYWDCIPPKRALEGRNQPLQRPDREGRESCIISSAFAGGARDARSHPSSAVTAHEINCKYRRADLSGRACRPLGNGLVLQVSELQRPLLYHAIAGEQQGM